MNINKLISIYNDAFSKKANENHFKLNNIHTIHLIDDIAYIIVLDSIDIYEIYEIAVKKQFQNKGYATKLMSKLPTDKPIHLEVNCNNIAAIKLYEKFNFKKIHIRKNYYKSEDAIIMSNEQ